MELTVFPYLFILFYFIHILQDLYLLFLFWYSLFHKEVWAAY